MVTVVYLKLTFYLSITATYDIQTVYNEFGKRISTQIRPCYQIRYEYRPNQSKLKLVTFLSTGWLLEYDKTKMLFKN